MLAFFSGAQGALVHAATASRSIFRRLVLSRIRTARPDGFGRVFPRLAARTAAGCGVLPRRGLVGIGAGILSVGLLAAACLPRLPGPHAPAFPVHGAAMPRAPSSGLVHEIVARLNRWLHVPGSVVVTPKDSTVYQPPATTRAVTFFVTNTRFARTTYRLSCASVTPLTSCTPGVSSVTLDSMQTTDVSVAFTVSSTLATGKLYLIADTAGVARDSGWVNVVVEHTVPSAVAQPRQNDSVFNRGHCLTTSRGPMTWSCGDAMYFLSTPGFTTLDRDRSMTLVYASNTVEPAPLIAANVTPSIGPNLTSVHALLIVNDTIRRDVVYSGWTNGIARQIVLGWNATNQRTGVYRYTLRVYAVSGSDSNYTDAFGFTTVVNRTNAAYGSGWEWLGVERLIFNQPFNTSGNSNILWVDGDASTRLYHQTSTNHWLSARDDGQDSIVYNPSTSEYTRTARHGVQVVFDNSGRHVRTVNRAGQVTTFAWLDSMRLDSVLLAPSGSGKAFKVQYASGLMSGIHLDGTRDIRDTVITGSGTPTELTRWIWPDGTNMRYGYESHHRVVYSVYSDADWMWTTYDTTGTIKWTDVYWNNPADSGLSTSSDLVSITNFTEWRTFGFALPGSSSATAADTAGAYTTIDGPPHGVGHSTTFAIDKWGAPTYERNAYGTVTTYVRGDTNAPGLVSQVNYANNRQVLLGYDVRGNLDSMVDHSWGTDSFPRQVTRWQYTDSNDPDSPSQVTAPDGTNTYYTYNTMGLTASVTDQRGHVTSFAYNTSGTLAGELTSVTEQSVPTWIESLQHDSTMNLVTSITLDALGNDSLVQNPAGGVSRWIRDAAGRVTSTTNALGYVQHYVFDAMDRVTKQVSLHAKGPIGAGCITTQFTCDTTLIIDHLNPSDTNTTISAADSAVTAYTYDLGRLIRVLDPRGVLHQYDYDQLGRVIRNYDEVGRVDSIYYDSAGHVSKVIQRNGATLRFFYDSLGREVKWKMPAFATTIMGTTYTAPADSVLTTYDAMGNALVRQDRSAIITRTYYANGVLRSEITTNPTGIPQAPDTVAYLYNTRGQLATMAWPRGDTVQYRYDATTADLDSVTARWRDYNGMQQFPTITLQTDVMGRRRGMDYHVRSMTDTVHYDALGVIRRLKLINSAGPSGPTPDNRFNVTVLQDSVDVLGRPLHRRVRCDSMAAPDSMQGTPCGGWAPYDNSTRYNRVGEVVVQAGLAHPTASFNSDTFWYDRSGNRRMMYDQIRGYYTKFIYPSSNNRVSESYDTNSSLPHSLSARYPYDSMGSRRADISHGLAVYQYDGAGRMAGRVYTEFATRTDVSGNIDAGYADVLADSNSCHYDGQGRLFAGCGVHLASYEGLRVSREHYGDWWYVLGPGLDDPVLVVKRGYQGNPNMTEAVYPIVSDGRGQLIAVADTNGEFQGNISNMEYDAGLWNSSGLTAAAQTFDPRRQTMAGGAAPISTFRARQYDPATGKWLQEDPIGLAGGTNLYEYNGNDPNSFSDPMGLCPLCAAALVVGEEVLRGAVVGAVTGGIEQAAVNRLHGKPLMSGMARAVETGAVVGAVTGGVGSALRIGRAVGLARSATEAIDVRVASRAEAEAAGELHVGRTRVPMVDRQTGSIRGIRNPITGAKFRPEVGSDHVNLENSLGGNVHVRFPPQ